MNDGIGRLKHAVPQCGSHYSNIFKTQDQIIGMGQMRTKQKRMQSTTRFNKKIVDLHLLISMLIAH